MKNINELYNAYLAKDQEERRINERIVDRELQIKRLEKKKRKIGGWIDNLVIPLAKILMPLLECESYEILGPFGLRGETSIWFKKPNSTAQYCDYRLCLTVETKYDKNYTYKGSYCSPVMNEVYLSYDTGKRNNEYQEGSIGYLNGYNNVEAPLPESIDEIVKIIKKEKGD